jgi:hypothetical protein
LERGLQGDNKILFHENNGSILTSCHKSYNSLKLYTRQRDDGWMARKMVHLVEHVSGYPILPTAP